MSGILDPTIPRPEQRIDYAPRPANLRGLRIGVIDSTKRNSEAVLRNLAHELQAKHGMTLEVLVRKPQRAPLLDAQIEELRGKTDFAIAGIGD
jgi:hypothetical protein